MFVVASRSNAIKLSLRRTLQRSVLETLF